MATEAPSPSDAGPSSAPVPDVMNDPAYATNEASNANKNPDEGDTCRICRGEGTADEPLFYPCKCSGSIKFVHQDCLMEWLSHSQKKYCELCKTPFRFTKLYSPQMPQRLPTLVFLRRAFVHILQHVLMWVRGVLVGTVWLVVLPWCMRLVWRCAFYVGDSGWYFRSPAQELAYINTGIDQAMDQRSMVSDSLNQGLTDFENRTLEAIGNVTLQQILPSFLMPFSQTLNMSAGMPMAFIFFKTYFWDVGFSAPSFMFAEVNATRHNASLAALQAHKESSLLSDVKFLNSFTASAAVNRFLMDVFEGQIITVFVVIAFILVFLIREWVVQQQPLLNMAAALNNQAANRPQQPNAPAPRPERPQAANAVADEEWEDEASADDNAGTASAPDITLGNEVTASTSQRQGDSWLDKVKDQRFFPGTEGRVNDGPSFFSPNNEILSRAYQLTLNLPQELGDVVRNGTVSDVVRLVERAQPEHRSQLRELIVAWSDALKESKRYNEEMLGQTKTDFEKQTQEILSSNERATVEERIRQNEERIAQNRQEMQKLESRMRSEFPKKFESAEESNVPDSWDDEVDAGSASARPPMPSRARSSVAVHIKRTLEEIPGEQRQPDWEWPDVKPAEEDSENAQSATNVADAEDNRPEGHTYDEDSVSSDSWQQVSQSHTPESPSDGSGEATASKDKGKQRAASPPSQAHENQTDSTRVIPALSRSTTDGDGSAAVPPDTIEPRSEVLQAIDDAAEESERELQDPPAELQDQPLELQDQNAELQDQDTAVPMPQGEPTFIDQVSDWLWGDIAPANLPDGERAQDVEQIVHDLANEPPFVHFEGAHAHPHRPAPPEPEPPAVDEDQDPEVAAAAAEAGIDVNDQEALDDAEDLEGILELIGMAGPLTGLIQNTLFCALLVSATIGCAMWTPYLLGKFVLLFIGNPVTMMVQVPLRLMSATADLIADFSLMVGAGIAYCGASTANAFIAACLFVPSLLKGKPYFSLTATNRHDFISGPASQMFLGALERIGGIVRAGDIIIDSEIFHLSVQSHIALRTIQKQLLVSVHSLQDNALALYDFGKELTLRNFAPRLCVLAYTALHELGSYLTRKMADLIAVLSDWRSIPVPSDGHPTEIEPTLELWSATDRIWAIVAGYAFVALIGSLYLKKSKPFTTSEQGKRIEGMITDVLQQAGGVLKVILIISIEMMVFPLYCGMLLDIGLLPLFENATIWSRYQFTLSKPWTSAFVHWFVGTCYMFHFALFVSMCRKIMRSGVLYFIRDPDDPTFHPVRDVLERNFLTQLRKIAFSALVYGGLVIICLGGVVWSMAYAFQGVLPIHWASDGSASQFGLDLLVYNFLMPLIIKVFKPADGMHAMYQWWFRRCARMLRLSDFLFGEKRKDEEGRHVRKTWRAWLARKKGDVEEPIIGHDRQLLADDREKEVYFLFDGKYVRAPASDQVRIPRGNPVFVDINEFNSRQDGSSDAGGVHSGDSDMTTKVYVPPWFRVRIALFVITIWLFAAATGGGITIIPLMFGRTVFSIVLEPDMHMNDIYAFSVGVYTLGGVAYLVWKLRALYSKLLTSSPSISIQWSSLSHATSRFANFTYCVLSTIYVYFFLILALPVLFAILLELYVLVPLHTYLGPSEPHIIRLVPDWTLGLIYARIMARWLLYNRQSRPARALRAVVADGYFRPNARLATRCFIVPMTLLFMIFLTTPPIFAGVVNKTYFRNSDADTKVHVHRLAYPALLITGASIYTTWMVKGAIVRWRSRIKDEVYLIGERLHNFGEKKPAPGTEKAKSAGGAGAGAEATAEAEAAATGTVRVDDVQNALAADW